MKTRIIMAFLILIIACPTVSHGFGLLRYVFDGISNQLGLDRGPIPKVVPGARADFDPTKPPPLRHPDAHRIHIQAEGF
jgi:hypothetical protein